MVVEWTNLDVDRTLNFAVRWILLMTAYAARALHGTVATFVVIAQALGRDVQILVRHVSEFLEGALSQGKPRVLSQSNLLFKGALNYKYFYSHFLKYSFLLSCFSAVALTIFYWNLIPFDYFKLLSSRL